MSDTVPAEVELFGQAFADLCQEVEALGFDGVVYTFYPKSFHKSIDMQPVLQYSTKFEPFVKHYIANDYGNRDFVIRIAFKGAKKSIDWWEEINNGNVRDDELQVTLDGRDNFGIQNGITVPVLKGPYAIAGISAITMNPDKANFRKLKSEKLDTLILCAREYHFRVMATNSGIFEFVESIIQHLDTPKKIVIKQLLKNQPMKTIESWDSGLTAKNAETILRNLKQELGSISTNQLMYLLGKMDAEKLL